MVLPRQEIRKLISGSPPLLESFLDLEDQLQPNGFDLSVRDVAALTSAGRMGVSKDRTLSSTSKLPFDASGFVDLAPGSYLITFNEVVNLPRRLMAIGRPRSSLLRCGVSVPSAVWDAGYSGRSQSLLVIHNPAGFRLQRGARVLQLIFLLLSDASEIGYAGAYQRENL